MAGTGRLVVNRLRGSWRMNRARPDVRVDGRVRGQLAASGQVESVLSAGEHRVQVGRDVVASGGMVFVGSPELVVVVDADGETTVRVDPPAVRGPR